MKIGEFAKEHGVKKSTVRYYVDKNLLVPKKSESYPDFHGECHKDMELILEFKSMGLSVKDISKILIKKRMNQRMTKKQVIRMEDTLKKKRVELNEDLIEIENKIKNIDTYIDAMNRDRKEEGRESHGIATNLLEEFSCPTCNDNYRISEATIKEGKLVDGELICSCGMRFKLQQGIIEQIQPRKNQEDLGEKQLLDVYKIEVNQNINSEIKNEYYSQLKNASVYMIEKFRRWKQEEGVLFINADTEVLTLGLVGHMNRSGRYYFASKCMDTLKNLRELFMEYDIYNRCVFISYEDELPISGEAAYFVDLGGYADDVIGNKKNWTVEKIQRTLSKMSEGIYLDFGYYETQESYIEAYENLGFNGSLIYEKSITADKVLENHQKDQIVKIKVSEFTSEL